MERKKCENLLDILYDRRRMEIIYNFEIIFPSHIERQSKCESQYGAIRAEQYFADGFQITFSGVHLPIIYTRSASLNLSTIKHTKQP